MSFFHFTLYVLVVTSFMKDAPFYLIIERQSDSIVKYQPGKSKEIDNENSERTEKILFSFHIMY